MAAALQVNVDEYIQRHGSERDGNNHALVVLVAAGVKFPDGEMRILPSWPSDSVVNLQVNAALEPVIHNI